MLQNLIDKDIYLMNLIRGLINPSSSLQVHLVTFFSDFGVIFVMASIIALWLYGIYKKENIFKEKSLMIFYSIAIVFIAYLVLNRFLPIRQRPELFSTIRPLVDHLPDNSFPSGHGIFAGAAVFACFAYIRRKAIAYIVLVLSIIMLLSRVIAGVHYPSDVIVGFLIGIFGAFVLYKGKESSVIKKYLLPYPIRLASLIRL